MIKNNNEVGGQTKIRTFSLHVAIVCKLQLVSKTRCTSYLIFQRIFLKFLQAISRLAKFNGREISPPSIRRDKAP